MAKKKQPNTPKTARYIKNIPHYAEEGKEYLVEQIHPSAHEVMLRVGEMLSVTTSIDNIEFNFDNMTQKEIEDFVGEIYGKKDTAW